MVPSFDVGGGMLRYAGFPNRQSLHSRNITGPEIAPHSPSLLEKRPYRSFHSNFGMNSTLRACRARNAPLSSSRTVGSRRMRRRLPLFAEVDRSLRPIAPASTQIPSPYSAKPEGPHYLPAECLSLARIACDADGQPKQTLFNAA